MEMDYDSTTIKFTVSFVNDVTREEILEKLEKLNLFFLKKSELYGFRLFQNNEVIEGSNCENIFNEYIHYINTNLKEEEGSYFIENSGPYKNLEWPDLEYGEMEYDHSLNLSDYAEYASIYVTMRQFYASEIEFLPNESIGISCEMVDIDGDWYEFEI